MIGYLARLFVSYNLVRLSEDADRSRKALETLTAPAPVPSPSLGQAVAERRLEAGLAASEEVRCRAQQDLRLLKEGYEAPRRVYQKNALATTFNWAAGHEFYARYHPSRGVYAVSNSLDLTLDIYKAADFHQRFGLWEERK